MEEDVVLAFVSPAQQGVLPMAKRKKRKLTVKNAQKVKANPTANRNFKDTVFRKLFSDKENLLSLYNAINGTAYEDSEKLEIVTLENAIYMGMKNDLAFIIDTGLFLYEHQSTYNPNLPLRDLFYISSEYQELVNDKSLYSSTLQKIPAPSFIVFYNGTQKKEDRWENYLSEAYENQDGEPNLELKVITLNINEGHNRELMEQCRTLKEYAQYVATVRNYAKELELNKAVERAVSECIQEGILSEFLQKNKARVIAMSIFEYDKEKEEKKLREAEYEGGYDSGYNSGYNSGYETGIIDGEIKTARSFYEIGFPIAKIAEGFKVSEETILGWIKQE